MKKSISVFSIFVLGLFLGTANASESSLEETIWEQPSTEMIEGGQAIEEPDIHAPWPFQPSDTYPGNPEIVSSRIDQVKADQSVDDDGQTQFPVELDDPTVESD